MAGTGGGGDGVGFSPTRTEDDIVLARNKRWGQGRGLWLACAFCVSLYLSYVTFLAQSALFKGMPETIYSLAWFVAYAVAWFAGLLWTFRRAGCGLRWIKARRQKFPLRFFLLSAGIALLITACSLLANYPGGISYDVYNQWMQALTGEYNSWHPVFHTLLIRLGLLVTGQYPLLLALQLVFFSLTMAYLAATLATWGIPRGLVLVLQGLVITSSIVCNSLMYLWKDNAMTMGAAVLCAQCLNVYFSKGEWIRKRRNAVMMGLMLCLITLVRHNGFFYTAPIIIILLLCYRQSLSRVLLICGSAALSLLLVMGPLYGVLDIVHPHNTFEESVGIPMTMLLDVRVKNPGAMDAESRTFLDGLAEPEFVATHYRLGDYNSIKFAYPREKINAVPFSTLLRMVTSTLRNDPLNSFEAFNAVTGLVWDVTGKNQGTVAVSNAGYLEAYPVQYSHVNQLGEKLENLFHIPLRLAPLRWVFENIGVQMAILLVCGLWALYRNGPRSLILSLPMILYNLGTMLLLCGNDARFFQFFMVLALPSSLALCQRQN